MSTESPASVGRAREATPSARSRSRTGWKDWLLLAACGAGLLLLSQALWLWQTWPVRELLQAAPR
jgi:hypothetical protein